MNDMPKGVYEKRVSSLSKWKYILAKKMRRRAEKFRAEAKTTEGFRAWGEVAEWLDSIIEYRRFRDRTQSIVLDYGNAVCCPHCGKSIAWEDLKMYTLNNENLTGADFKRHHEEGGAPRA